jgi:hypothetical protein
MLDQIRKIMIGVYRGILEINMGSKASFNISVIRSLVFIVISSVIWSQLLSATNTTESSACSQYSAKDSDEFWVSIGRCASCAQEQYCGFCQSTLQCLNGTIEGPLNGVPCPSWSFSGDSCPGKK